MSNMTADKEIWVTELADYEACPAKWNYKWHERLRVADSSKVGLPLLLGRSIHTGLEAGMLLGWDNALYAALTTAASLEMPEEELEKITNAMSVVPGWVRNIHNPQSEQPLRLTVDSNIILAGKPDVWWIDDAGGHVVELKSTADHAKNRLRSLDDYDLQLPRYATLLMYHALDDKQLSALWPGGMPVEYRYLVLSWRGEEASGEWQNLTQRTACVILDDMQAVAQLIVNTVNAPMHRSKMCQWCDFDSLCTTRLTGGDIGDIMQSAFVKHPKRESNASVTS